MLPVAAGLGVLALILAVVCWSQRGKLAELRRERDAMQAALLAEKNKPAPEPPPRQVQTRREAFALAWFPELKVDDRRKLIVAATAGMPHCAKCLRQMRLDSRKIEDKTIEEWVCGKCEDRRAGTAADYSVAESVVAEAVREFLALNEGYQTALGLKLPAKARP